MEKTYLIEQLPELGSMIGHEGKQLIIKDKQNNIGRVEVWNNWEHASDIVARYANYRLVKGNASLKRKHDKLIDCMSEFAAAWNEEDRKQPVFFGSPIPQTLGDAFRLANESAAKAAEGAAE